MKPPILSKIDKFNYEDWEMCLATATVKTFSCERCGASSSVNEDNQPLKEGEHAFCHDCNKFIWKIKEGVIPKFEDE